MGSRRSELGVGESECARLLLRLALICTTHHSRLTVYIPQDSSQSDGIHGENFHWVQGTVSVVGEREQDGVRWDRKADWLLTE
jgi:hypothetical protein